MVSFGNKVIPWSMIKWVVSYPSDTEHLHYTHGNAQQWTSTKHFNGSQGDFDASESFTNYYTAN